MGEAPDTKLIISLWPFQESINLISLTNKVIWFNDVNFCFKENGDNIVSHGSNKLRGGKCESNKRTVNGHCYVF
jgi:hypothetical protein